MPEAARGVGVVGAVAVSGGCVFSAFLWRGASSAARSPQPASVRFLGYVAAPLVAALAWVWLLYALNPFRVHPILDAIVLSRSTPWQLSAGLCLFASIVFVANALARQTASQSASAPEIGPPAPENLHVITVRIGHRTDVVAVEHIDRFQAWDDHVALFVGGRRMLSSLRLTELASRLDPARFVRVHRSHIVNLQRVKSLERRDAHRDVVIMTNGDRVPASRSGTLALRQRLSR
jgi:two-component system LytT family response regulator